DGTPRICPRCHNATVVRATSRMWFSFFFLRVIPLRKNQIWICSTCNWNVPAQNGWEPALASGNPGWSPHQPAHQSPYQIGYQPSYETPPHGY
ncbi:hypothetical protein BC826DRAFT_909126, partial [Russula brevipes]